jgi:hypothetical protein
MGKRKAKKAEKQDKPKKKKHGFRKLLFLLVVGGAGALVVSEDLRNKALDLLFGSEEEFQYSPPVSDSGDGAGGTSASV